MPNQLSRDRFAASVEICQAPQKNPGRERQDEQKIASDPAPTPKKEGGCGCGKKKNIKPAVDEVPVNTPEGKKPSILDYGVSETQGWNELPKELKAMVASKTSNCGKKKKQTPKFRSMVDGTPLTNND